MMTYVYCRTSELELAPEGERQEAAAQDYLTVRTYCVERGLLVTESLCDEGCNWKLEFHRRHEAKRLLTLLQAGDRIVCSRLEQIVGSGAETLELIRRLKNMGVELHVVELGGDVTSPELAVNCEKMVQIFADLEKRKSAERIKGVKGRLRKEGLYLGGSRPFGYMIHQNGRLIEYPMEQQKLKKIVELRKQGKSLRAISSEVSTPLTPVSFKTVQRLLQRHANGL